MVLLLLEGVEEGVGHLLLEVEADRVAVGDLEEREGEVVRHLLPRQDQEEQEGLGRWGGRGGTLFIRCCRRRGGGPSRSGCRSPLQRDYWSEKEEKRRKSRSPSKPP